VVSRIKGREHLFKSSFPKQLKRKLGVEDNLPEEFLFTWNLDLLTTSIGLISGQVAVELVL